MSSSALGIYFATLAIVAGLAGCATEQASKPLETPKARSESRAQAVEKAAENPDKVAQEQPKETPPPPLPPPTQPSPPKPEVAAQPVTPPKVEVSPKIEDPPKSPPIIPASTPPPPSNSDANTKNLLGADLAFSRVCEEKGTPEGFYQYMSSDGVCLFAGEPAIQGRDAIKIHLAASLQGAFTWKPREAKIGSTGDLGYTWGMYEFRGTNPDSKQPMIHGKYVIIWKKHADGIWKVNLFSTSPGPALPNEK